MKTISIVTALLLGFSTTQAQITFEKTYGGANADAGVATLPQADGTFITLGNTTSYGAGASDIYLVKTDRTGATLWTKTYGGNGNELATAIRQTADNGFIIAGSTTSTSEGGMDAAVIRTDADGNVTWSKTYGGAGDDAANAVQETANGFIIAGSTTSFGGGQKDAYLLNIDAAGTSIWAKSFGGSSDEQANSVAVTADGGYFLTGTTSGAGNTDVYIVKTDVNGNKTWSKTIGGAAADDGNAGVQTTDGGYIITGSTNSFGADQDIYLVKTDANGTIIFSKTFSANGNDAANSVKQTPEGGFIIAGSAGTTQGNLDACIIKTDASGMRTFVKTFGDVGDEAATDVAQTVSGYVITGTITSESGDANVYLIETDTALQTSCNGKMLMMTDMDVTSAVSNASDASFTDAATVISAFAAGIGSGVTTNTRCYADADALHEIVLDSFLPDTANTDINVLRTVTAANPAVSIVLYPNPARGQFNISGLTAGNKIEIFDVKGQMVYQSVCTGDVEAVDITAQAKGLYFYRITTATALLKSGKVVNE